MAFNGKVYYMNKYIRGFMIFAVCIILSGCNSQSLDDFYTRQTNQSKEISEKDKVLTVSYEKNILASDVRILEMGDYASMIGYSIDGSKTANNIEIQVVDAAMCDSIYDMEIVSGYDESDFYDKIKKLSKAGGVNNKLQDDGSFRCPSTGVENICLFVKVKVSNKSDESVELGIGNMNIVSLSQNKEAYERISYVSDSMFDKLVHTNSDSSYYEFKPHEELETVFIYICQKERILSYSIKENIEDKKNISIVIEKEYIDFNTLYLRANISGNPKSVSGECYIKLSFRESGDNIEGITEN